MNMNDLPQSWQFTLVGNPKWQHRDEAWQKIPFHASWQTKPVSLANVCQSLAQKTCTGFGLLTGEMSGGLLAIDIDGPQPLAFFRRLAGGELPHTTSWTSGKPDRLQVLFRVPSDYWPLLKEVHRKVQEWRIQPTGGGVEIQQLDFRWNSCQSVLPPSAHPTTGHYRWIHAPGCVAPAVAPAWLLDYLERLIKGEIPTLMTEDGAPWLRQHQLLGSTAPTAAPEPPLGQPHPQKLDVLDKPDPLGGGQRRLTRLPLPVKPRTRSVTTPPPLEVCLTRSDRDLIAYGTSQGNRNTAGAKLARNLIGTGSYLDQCRYEYTSTPRMLFDQFCDRCTPSLKPREADRIWTSASKSSPTPSLSEDAIANCIHAWERQQYSVKSFDRTPHMSSPATLASTRDLPPGPRPVQQHYAAPRDLGLAHTLTLNAEMIDTAASVRDLQSRSLDLSDFLHPYLAEPFKQVAAAMPTAPEMLLTTGLPIWLSLVGNAAEIEMRNDRLRWSEPAVLWTMNVGPTGCLKTPTQKVLMEPLWELQLAANYSYEKKLKEWQAKKTQHEAQRKESKRKDANVSEFSDPEPVPREYWLGDATLEALIKAHGENPRGFLKYHDEIDGFFHSFNKYRKGDDEQCWLAMNDGAVPVKHNRVARERRVELKRTAVSITGSIQPETLATYLGTNRDTSGLNARWVYCAAPMPAPYYTGKEVTIDVYERLGDIYRKLSRLPADERPIFDEAGVKVGSEIKPIRYRPTREAGEYFHRHWADPITRRWQTEAHPGFRGVLAKWRGFCARVALALHCVNEVAKLPDVVTLRERNQSVKIPEQISLKTFKQAIALAHYYVDQAEALYKGNNKDSEDYTSALNILIDLSESRFAASGNGLVRPSELRQRSRRFPTSKQAEEFFIKLATPVEDGGLGIGELVYTGRTHAWRFQTLPPESGHPQPELASDLEVEEASPFLDQEVALDQEGADKSLLPASTATPPVVEAAPTRPLPISDDPARPTTPPPVVEPASAGLEDPAPPLAATTPLDDGLPGAESPQPAPQPVGGGEAPQLLTEEEVQFLVEFVSDADQEVARAGADIILALPDVNQEQVTTQLNQQGRDWLADYALKAKPRRG